MENVRNVREENKTKNCGKQHKYGANTSNNKRLPPSIIIITYASLVELNSPLGHLGLLIESLPAVVDEIISEVTNELSSGDVLHDKDLEEADESEQLKEGTRRERRDSVEARGNVGELGAGEVNVSGQTNAGLGDEVSNNGKHGNTSVLDLDIPEAVEVALVTVGDKSEGIEESERSLGAELVLEGLEGGGGGGLLGGSESGGGGDEGGKDGELHGVQISFDGWL